MVAYRLLTAQEVRHVQVRNSLALRDCRPRFGETRARKYVVTGHTFRAVAP